jgi:predicted nucleic acid-binding protein
MSGDFVDSNVFVYLVEGADLQKTRTAQELIAGYLKSFEATISYQVVQETLNVLTSKIAQPLSADEAGLFLETTLLPLWKVQPEESLFRDALRLRERYRFGFYDSLIISAALEGGCDRLISEDFQHGQRIEGLIVHDPFL